MKTKAAVYFWNKDMIPVIKRLNRIQEEYEIVKVYTPSGMGNEGDDIGFLCNQPDTGICLHTVYDPKCEEWEKIIVISTEKIYEELTQEVCKVIEDTITEKKEILCIFLDKNTLPKVIKEMLSQYKSQIEVEYLCKDYKEPEIGGIKELDAPVILVGGMIRQADVMELTLQIYEELIERGMKVELVLQSTASKLLKVESVLPILKEKNLYEDDKIICMNELLNKIERKRKPDVILMDAPDALFPYSNRVSNSFGMWSRMLGYASAPDYIFLTVPCNMAKEEMLTYMSDTIKKEFGTDVEAIHISNVAIHEIETFYRNRIVCYYRNMHYVKEVIATLHSRENVLITNFMLDKENKPSEILFD